MADIDEIGIAVALCYLPDAERTLHTEYRTDGDFPQENPMLAAEALVESCRDDFPGGLWTTTGNERALDIMVSARMKALGFDDYDHAEERRSS